MSEQEKMIQCVEKGCGTFPFSIGEQAFFRDKGYPFPKRCKEHRQLKKQRQEENENKENSPFNPKNFRKDKKRPLSDKDLVG